MYRVLFLLIIPIGMMDCIAQQATMGDIPPAAKKMKNRASLTGEKMGAVAELYREKCVTCHGRTGASDGPLASRLSTEPANFTNARMMDRWKDGALFWVITKGRSPMPAYQVEVSEIDRWQLVKYVRYLTWRSQYRYLGVRQTR